jgi:hypothetical protein
MKKRVLRLDLSGLKVRSGVKKSVAGSQERIEKVQQTQLTKFQMVGRNETSKSVCVANSYGFIYRYQLVVLQEHS